MTHQPTITGKRVLIVDDEPDILTTLEDLLDGCRIEKAADFATAKSLLENHIFDAAILDIMGVNGYDLLEITRARDIPTLMLTAHALTPEDFAKSLESGALAYVPKDRISEIDLFLSDILEAHEKGLGRFGRWYKRLDAFFEDRFGRYWQQKLEKDPEFWKNYI